MKIRLLALAFGFFLVGGTAYAGPTPGGTDNDSDTVEDVFDNCTLVANPTQTDTDHNGCGDACTTGPITCDINGDTTVGAPDQIIIGANFNMVVPIGTLGDCRNPAPGDGTVGAPDLIGVGSEFLNMVGPSGITTAQCDPNSCNCTPQ